TASWRRCCCCTATAIRAFRCMKASSSAKRWRCARRRWSTSASPMPGTASSGRITGAGSMPRWRRISASICRTQGCHGREKPGHDVRIETLRKPVRAYRGIHNMTVDTQAATDRLMRFLAIEGVTGKEQKIGRELTAALKESGVPDRAIRLDDANTRIPVPTETGNLIVDLPGRGAMHNQPRIMFMTHMDTVPLCAGAKPKRSGRKIVNEAKTALGGDNRCGCGVLVTLAAELAKQTLDHPPITLLFCVREESGLWGARHVKTEELGSPVLAFNYDGGSASNVTI